jgi:hypothetical protein
LRKALIGGSVRGVDFGWSAARFCDRCDERRSQRYSNSRIKFPGDLFPQENALGMEEF